MAFRQCYSGGLQAAPTTAGGVTTQTATQNRDLFTAVGAGTPTVQASAIDTGRPGLRFTPSAAASVVAQTLGDIATNKVSGVCYRGKVSSFATLIPVCNMTCSTTADNISVAISTAGVWQISFNNRTSWANLTGFPTYVVGQVFRLDIVVDWGAGTTHTASVALTIQGVTYTSSPTGGTTISTASLTYVGSPAIVAGVNIDASDIYWYDAVADWNTMKDHRVWGLPVNASGTHHATKFAHFQTAASAALASASETTSFGEVDDSATGAPDTTTYIKQVTADATADSYAEYQFADLPALSGVPKLVCYELGGFPIVAVTANSFGHRLNDGGTVSAETAYDLSIAISTLEYHVHTYAAPPSGGSWTAGLVNALRGRIGFSANDVSPVPCATVLYLEVLCDFTHNVAQPNEADTAQAITGRKSKAIGQASTTQTAQPIQPTHARTLGQASATMTAQPLAGKSKSKTVGMNQETDTAQPATRQKRKAVGQPSETDSPQPIGRTHARTLGQPSEADTAQTIASKRKTKAVGQPSEADTAQPIARVRSRTLGLATETDSAQPVARSKSKAVGQTSEADTAQATSRRKQRTLGQNVEADTAQHVTRQGGVNQAIETDTAQPVTRQKRRATGQPAEADTAQTIKPARARTLSQPAEADTAQPILRRKSKTIGQPSEADVAQPASRRKTRTLGQNVEAETAQPISKLHSRSVGQPSEADTAQTATRRKSKAVGITLENDVAQPVVRVKRVPLGLAVESDQAFNQGRNHRRTLGQLLETDVSLAMTPTHTARLGIATETDMAQPIRPKGSGIVGPPVGAQII